MMFVPAGAVLVIILGAAALRTALAAMLGLGRQEGMVVLHHGHKALSVPVYLGIGLAEAPG